MVRATVPCERCTKDGLECLVDPEAAGVKCYTCTSGPCSFVRGSQARPSAVPSVQAPDQGRRAEVAVRDAAQVVAVFARRPLPSASEMLVILAAVSRRSVRMAGLDPDRTFPQLRAILESADWCRGWGEEWVYDEPL